MNQAPRAERVASPRRAGWPARKLSVEHDLWPSQLASDPGGGISPAQPWAACPRVPALAGLMPTRPLCLTWHGGARMLSHLTGKNQGPEVSPEPPAPGQQGLSPRPESEPSSGRAAGQGLARPAGHSGSFRVGQLAPRKLAREENQTGLLRARPTPPFPQRGHCSQRRKSHHPIPPPESWSPGGTPLRAAPLPSSPALWGTNGQGLGHSMGMSEAARPTGQQLADSGPFLLLRGGPSLRAVCTLRAEQGQGGPLQW